MSESFWHPSAEQRRTILLLEVAGLLHDLGKLSSGFIKRVASDPPENFSYDYDLLADPNTVFRQIPRSTPGRIHTMQNRARNANIGAPFKDRPDMTQYLQAHALQSWDTQPYNLAEILLLTAPTDLNVNWSQILGKSMQPAILIGYLHGVAHYEKEEAERDEKRKRLYTQPYAGTYAASPFGVENLIPVDIPGSDLTAVLAALPLQDIAKIDTERRLEWVAAVRKHLEKGTAETQRPTNEVSLWDWGYTVATMTKAGAAWIFKNGWPATLEALPFRTLRIHLDILARYTRSDKISDLLGVRHALDDAFRQVQTLLEETYALGNRFYHDETGAYYLFPDMLNAQETDALRQLIQAQFPPDLRPQVHLGERVTAGHLDERSPAHDPQAVHRLVAGPRAQALQEAAVRAENNLYLFGTEWTEGRPDNAETCMVCGVRPVGYPRQGLKPEEEQELGTWADPEKAKLRNVCRVCLDRRGRRSKEWATTDLPHTIWTDEVADDTGRLALFVGRLGLEGWLDGSLLSTLPVTSNTTKNPSPARLYRIAETARTFWRQVIYDLTPHVVGQRSFRLGLYPQGNKLAELGDYHTYELAVNGLALSVVWDKPNDRFLTTENLAYFAHRWHTTQDELAGRLQGRTFDVLEPSSFQRPGQALVKVRIERVETLDSYQAAIPLLAEPGVCMTLVPADKALALARAVKCEYERQMGRVRDRLPLYLGLVFCRRRTPIRAVLEAGRAMLDMAGSAQWEGWRVIRINSSNSGECELVFDNGITWHIPVIAGDGQTPDIWYPNLYEGDSREQAQVKRVTCLRERGPQMPPEKVWVRPGRFDFEFLDTTGRRFEIYYDRSGRRPRRTRPFYLEDLDRLETLWGLMKRLAVSQRHQVIRTIEATRETWYGQDNSKKAAEDDVFRQFVADTLAGATWPSGQPWRTIEPTWREKLVQAGVGGELADLAELHMEILEE